MSLLTTSLLLTSLTLLILTMGSAIGRNTYHAAKAATAGIFRILSTEELNKELYFFVCPSRRL